MIAGQGLRAGGVKEVAAGTERGLCLRCLHSALTCYCHVIRRFDPGLRFGILIHGREAQKKIATGRLAHLSLERSELLPGYDYSNHPRVNEILTDPGLFPVVLYPGEGSTNLTTPGALASVPAGRELFVFVIDGTWTTARKTMQRSANLAALPRICFAPDRPSRFRVRKQPASYCWSTVEAIHETIELLGTCPDRAHDSLLATFDHMVDQQIALAAQPKRWCLWKAPNKSAGRSAPSSKQGDTGLVSWGGNGQPSP